MTDRKTEKSSLRTTVQKQPKNQIRSRGSSVEETIKSVPITNVDGRRSWLLGVSLPSKRGWLRADMLIGNHIACLCGTNYCFICAVPAEELSDHWNFGGCPRYGQPGSSSALYNNHIRLADNEAEIDAEGDDLWRWQIQTLREQEGLQPSEHTSTPSRSTRTNVHRDVTAQGTPSALQAPSKLGFPLQPSATAPQPGPKPKRGLRQIIQERRQELMDKFC